jgi:uncharacterized protein (TIGR01777 family)
MKIILAGGTGFLGGSLLRRLLQDGHQVILLTRNPQAANIETHDSLKIELWDAKSIDSWAGHIEGSEAIINLAGEPIGVKRWTTSQKTQITHSRVESTKVLVGAIAAATKKPSVLINASAVGYYGHVDNGEIIEPGKKGIGHLADTCEKWETQALAAQAQGVRVALLRYGIILEKEGGVLAKMLVPFKMFAGGPPGSGLQWVSWIHREDAVDATLFCLNNTKLSGPVNVSSPEPERMRQFCTVMAKAMGRPSWVPVPEIVLKTMLGEMSDVILTGQRAVPKKLIEAGFAFNYSRLEPALKAIFSSGK